MRAVIQRVTSARVRVGERVVGEIGAGLLLLAGVEKDDSLDDVKYISTKVRDLRIFGDSDGKMNLSLSDIGGSGPRGLAVHLVRRLPPRQTPVIRRGGDASRRANVV